MKIQVFEVGPRDGLQNESREVPLEAKLELVAGLAAAGLRDIEVGAFVRPDRVPQMADSEAIYRRMGEGALKLGPTVRAWALVPNMKGLERALAVGAKQIALFTAATDGFSVKNTGMTVDESLEELAHVARAAKSEKLKVRGYVSTVFGCPFEGEVTPAKALRVVKKLVAMDLHQISLGDTIGIATIKGVDRVVRPALRLVGARKLAVHFHDTRGAALANSLRAFEHGVRIFDSSAGGLGGCPFAPGATGNLATEDLIFLMHGMGVETGVDLNALCETSLRLAERIQRPLSSRYLQAYASSKKRRQMMGGHG